MPTEKTTPELGPNVKELKKAKYLRTALRVLEVEISPEMAELVYRTCRLIATKGGKGNLRDLVDIKAKVKTRYPE